MSKRIAINGFGRIGRIAFRKMFEDSDFEIVAINSMSGSETAAHLLKYDSAHGPYKIDSIKFDENNIYVDDKVIKVVTAREASEAPWKELNIDIVLECSGLYTSDEKAMAHIEAGAKRVVISAPATGNLKTIVYNVNHDILDGSEQVISCASCTTNCLAPVVQIIDKNYGIEQGFMTTIHAYTNDQNTLDNSHKKRDLRRGRTAAANIVPNSTGAAKAIGLVLPNLAGKLDGSAQRVPVIDGSLTEVVAVVNKQVSVEEINNAMKAAKNETLGYTEDLIVSTDVIGIEYGSYFDATQTKVIPMDNNKSLIKIASWYDNEVSYVMQMVRTIRYIGELM